jgi:RNA polymerase sigma-70 factor, ECF subfamily
VNPEIATRSLADDPSVKRSATPGAVGSSAQARAGTSSATAAAATAQLAAFVTEHYDRLLRLAWLVCRDRIEAADAVQAGLELAWRRRETLRDTASLRPWLDRIVVRAATRTASRRRSWLGRIFSARSELGWIELADSRIADRDDLLTLRAALARLSPDHRAVIALHLHAGYSVAETAELVGAPVETVRSRLRVARERLRRELEEAVR